MADVGTNVVVYACGPSEFDRITPPLFELMMAEFIRNGRKQLTREKVREMRRRLTDRTR